MKLLCAIIALLLLPLSLAAQHRPSYQGQELISKPDTNAMVAYLGLTGGGGGGGGSSGSTNGTFLGGTFSMITNSGQLRPLVYTTSTNPTVTWGNDYVINSAGVNSRFTLSSLTPTSTNNTTEMFIRFIGVPSVTLFTNVQAINFPPLFGGVVLAETNDIYIKWNGSSVDWFINPNYYSATLAKGTLPAASLPAFTGDVTTSAGSAVTTVAKIQGTAQSPTAPTQGQLMRYNQATVQMEATTLAELQPVMAVSTANVASLSGTTTIDSLAITAGQRVLLTAQSTASQNGPWTVNAGVWTRPTTYSAGSAVSPSALVIVVGGTVYANTMWQLTGTTTSITVDTTSTTWSQFPSKASSSIFGLVKVDGTTITATAGVISASASGAPSGTVVNSGTPPANAIPIYSDTTGTNITPSRITISGLTNLLTGQVTATNGVTVNGVSVLTNLTSSIGITLDGGGAVLTTGVKGYISIPYSGTIQSATMLADQSGSAVVDILKCTFSQFDSGSTHPVSGDKITASAPPTISSATKSQDTTLTGWTTTFSANDVFAFSVTSATTVTKINLVLKTIH